jgi:hypothetical protein
MMVLLSPAKIDHFWKRKQLVAVTEYQRSVSTPNADIWIISGGRDSQLDLSAIEGAKKNEQVKAVKEYRISDIGYYLLNPKPIEVDKRLIGCEIHYQQRLTTKIIEKIKRLFPRRIRHLWNCHMIPPEILLSHCKIEMPILKDKALENHLYSIYESLRAYESVSKRLPQLDPHQIAHVIGICQDIGGSLTYLKLQGSSDDKLKYMQNYISKNVGVLLSKAYIGDGLFEMRGFDFKAYDSGRAHRLIVYRQNGKPKCCVLNSKNVVEYSLNDVHLLKFLLLLQQALADDLKLNAAFDFCIRGEAKPVKLFFNRQLEVDYSKSLFPAIYRNILKEKKTNSNQQNLIRPALNYLQIGISFNYIPLPDSAADNMITLISVLHDLRALELLRKNLPQVYNEIEKRVGVSEAGRFYLLDSIEGCNNDE